MPPRSSLYRLDEATRESLDRRIIAAGFGDYADHASWLREQGHEISVAALQRYGRRLKATTDVDAARRNDRVAEAIARVKHTAEIAKAMNEAAGDDPLAIPTQTVELCMTRLYDLVAKDDIDAATLRTIVRALNESVRTMASVRSEREILAAAAQRVQKALKKSPLSKDTSAIMRAIIEGRAPPPEEPRPGLSDEALAAYDAVLMPETRKVGIPDEGLAEINEVLMPEGGPH